MTELRTHEVPRGWLRGVDYGSSVPTWHYYSAGYYTVDTLAPVVLSLCGQRGARPHETLYAWRDTNDRSCRVCLRRLCERRRAW